MPADGQIHWGGLLSLVLFYGVVLWVARYATQRYSTGTAADLMVARRSMPLWVGVCTMTATWVGGGYVNGTAEAAYGSGLVWAQAPWGYALSLVVGGLVFARPMRRRRFTTMLDPLEARYGRKVAAVLALPALSGEIFWTGAVLTALGSTFGAVLGLSFSVSIVISAAVAVAYTLLGGLWSVAAFRRKSRRQPQRSSRQRSPSNRPLWLPSRPVAPRRRHSPSLHVRPTQLSTVGQSARRGRETGC